MRLTYVLVINQICTIDFNDLVFGQTKGYPYWPAKVIMVNSHIFVNVIQYKVLFFATSETLKFNKSDF